jgi:adenine-specific DNA-methyltransferase
VYPNAPEKVSRLTQQEKSPPGSDFRTIRYLGNKRKLSEAIRESIEEVASEGNLFTDLFAGSCGISYRLKTAHQVFSNDNEVYSYNLAMAIIENEEDRVTSKQAADELGDTFEQHMEALSGQVKHRLAKEETLLFADPISPKSLSEYSSFCSRTPYVGGRERVGDMRAAITGARAFSGGGGKRNPWVLFTAYFSNAYFGLGQCIQIDSIRKSIEASESAALPYRKHLYLAALTYALSQGVSSPGHFAQFLKPSSSDVYERLQRERTMSIWTLFLQNLDTLSSFVVRTPFDHKATCEDWRSILKEKNHQSHRKGGVIYADPPYTADHYSRYYHVLNTLVLYDYPDCIGAGRYRSGRFASAFSIRSQATDEFRDLIKSAARTGASLVLSYSNKGVVKVRTILGICRGNFKRVKFRWMGHSHSNQGRRSGETNPAVVPRREYMISCSAPL